MLPSLLAEQSAPSCYPGAACIKALCASMGMHLPLQHSYLMGNRRRYRPSRWRCSAGRAQIRMATFHLRGKP